MKQRELLSILNKLYKIKMSVGEGFAKSYTFTNDSCDNELAISYFGEATAIATIIKLLEDSNFRNNIIRDYEIELED